MEHLEEGTFRVVTEATSQFALDDHVTRVQEVTELLINALKDYSVISVFDDEHYTTLIKIAVA